MKTKLHINKYKYKCEIMVTKEDSDIENSLENT